MISSERSSLSPPLSEEWSFSWPLPLLLLPLPPPRFFFFFAIYTKIYDKPQNPFCTVNKLNFDKSKSPFAILKHCQHRVEIKKQLQPSSAAVSKSINKQLKYAETDEFDKPNYPRGLSLLFENSIEMRRIGMWIRLTNVFKTSDHRLFHWFIV